MIRLAVDEDFNNDIVRALRRTLLDVSILGVREAGHAGRPDPEVLAWAAEEDRVLLTHDVTTLTRHALERIARGQSMPGVIAVHQRCRSAPSSMTWCSWPPVAFPATGSIRSNFCRFDSAGCTSRQPLTDFVDGHAGCSGRRSLRRRGTHVQPVRAT